MIEEENDNKSPLASLLPV